MIYYIYDIFRFRRRAIFRRNILRYMLLKALAEKPMYGYEIITVLGDEFGDPFDQAPAPSTLCSKRLRVTDT